MRKRSKILRARQLKKNQALNEIRKVLSPKYKFPYSQVTSYVYSGEIPSRAEEREKRISEIVEQLERDLKRLRVVGNFSEIK